MSVYLRIKPGEKLGIAQNKFEKGMRITPMDMVLKKRLTEQGYHIFPDRECDTPTEIPAKHAKLLLEQNPHLLTDKPTKFDDLIVADPPALKKMIEHNKVVYPKGTDVDQLAEDETYAGNGGGRGEEALIVDPEPVDLGRITEKIEYDPEAARRTIETLKTKDISNLKNMHLAKYMQSLGRNVVVPLDEDEYKKVLRLVAVETEKELAG